MKPIYKCLLAGMVLFRTADLHAQEPPENNILLADPSVYAEKGLYYLYGTGEATGFKVYTSKDLEHWNDGGFALKKGESFGDRGFWAPQVFKYRGKYHMAYVANEQIALATADSPLGPFKQTVLKHLKSTQRQIDPFVLIENGKIYLYHVRVDPGNQLFVAEMLPDLSDIRPETLKHCVSATLPWENTTNSWPVAEGPTVIKHKGLYYLFYTANDFRNPDYAVGYATSRHPAGPFTKFAGNPVLDKKLVKMNGTGHGDLFKGPGNKLFYVFHTHFSNTKVGRRRTAIVPLNFEKSAAGGDQVVPDASALIWLRETPGK
ncbi:beta-xylosidase [Pedobacter yulinensis]|uniref:Beta-xylosidase n=1 Tax=Pedobacter yulinensis TaxID=2126353 RepID=A0A2T3HN29_9SPHI|nr:glycoside hydrolase family 43 protein [Pedobacter yulinensis]PST83791.1 beta-xylosidase [Pedobacter yulinensis]